MSKKIMTKGELIDKFKEEFHTEHSPAIDYLEEMYLIGRLDGYDQCMEDYWGEIAFAHSF